MRCSSSRRSCHHGGPPAGSTGPRPWICSHVGPEHVIGRRVPDDDVVQAAHQAIALLLVDDERDVEVVRGLRDQVDALFLEQFERIAQPVQRGANAAPDEAHRGAGPDDFDAAEPRQRGHQRLERAAVERVRGRIERHGDAGLRRRHEVDRQAVLLEDGERIGEEADLVPHAERLEREQRDALLDADRLHARAAVAARRGDDRAFELGLLRGVHGQRNRVLLHRQDAARVQDLGAAARDFLRLVVIERLEQARVRHRLGIRREHAGHVGPDLEPARAELGREVTARRVGAAATEQHRVAVRVARDEALRDQHLAARRQPLLERGVGFEVARGGKVVRALGCAGPHFGVQQRARVEPLHVDAFRVQERRADARRHQFAVGHHARAQAIADLADQVDAFGAATQIGEVTIEFGVDVNAEIAREVEVTTLDLVHDRFPLAGQRFREQLLEAVRDAGQRRMHDDGMETFDQPRLDDAGDVLPVADARNAGAAKLEDDPVRFGMAGHSSGPRRDAQLGVGDRRDWSPCQSAWTDYLSS